MCLPIRTLVVANINSTVLTNRGVTIVNVRGDTRSSDDPNDNLIRVTVFMAVESSDISGECTQLVNEQSPEQPLTNRYSGNDRPPL